MLRSRILWKLFSGYVVLILRSISIVGILISKQVEEETLSEIERSLYVRAIFLRSIALELLSNSSNNKIQDRIKNLGKKTYTRFTVINSNGQVLADSQKNPKTMDNHGNRPEILAAHSHGQGITTRFSDTVKNNMMYYALAVMKDDKLIGYVRTSLPLSVRHRN